MTELQNRRTKRRYAHELYPHAAAGETRPLAVEVPYRLARALGLGLDGTNWLTVEPRTLAGSRAEEFVDAARIAFLADALHQGLAGDEAWEWADQKSNEEADQFLYERAEAYGIEPETIKPYPCGGEPDHHRHFGTPDSHGWRTFHTIAGPESECPECTEPIEAAS